MNRKALIEYLTDSCGCLVIKEASKGYSVVRNVVNGNMSGIPKEENLRSATVCRICKTLDVPTPAEAQKAQEIVDLAHNNHSRQ